MKLNYHRCGDYLLPDMGISAEERQPIGKYGQMRLTYLQEHHADLYSRLLLGGKLISHLVEVDTACKERLALLIPQMMEREGVTEALKETNQMSWFGRMNSIHERAEEILKEELIYA